MPTKINFASLTGSAYYFVVFQGYQIAVQSINLSFLLTITNYSKQLLPTNWYHSLLSDFKLSLIDQSIAYETLILAESNFGQLLLCNLP